MSAFNPKWTFSPSIALANFGRGPADCDEENRMAMLPKGGGGMPDAPEAPEALGRPRVVGGNGSAGGPFLLPLLFGRRLLAFRLLWSFALLLALAAPIAGFLFARVNEVEIFRPLNLLGLRGDPDGSLGRPFGTDVLAQGVEEGARVIIIDAEPVSKDLSRRELAALLRAAPGPVVHLTTLTASGEVRSHRLIRSWRHLRELQKLTGISIQQRQLITQVFNILAVTAAVLASLLMFFRRPRDPVAALLSLGFLLLAATGGFTRPFWDALGTPPFLPSALNSIGLAVVGLALITFPHGRFDTRWIGPLAFLLIGWCMFLPVNYHYRLLENGVATAGSVAVFMACLAVLSQRFRGLPPGMERQQIRWVLFGFAVAIAAGAVAAGALMLRESAEDEFVKVWSTLMIGVATALVTFFIASGFLVSLLRYRLYDAEAAISRSAAAAVLTLTLAAIYAGASKGLETYFETTFGREAGVAPGAIGAALAVVLFLPLNSRIQAWAERRFQAPLLRLRQDLPVCLGDMRETSSMAEVANETLDQLRVGVRARHSALVMGGEVIATCNIAPAEVASWYEATLIDKSQTLDCAPEDALFPLRFKLRPRSRNSASELGWILLGPRPDGSFFGKDEREVLGEIVDPAARAFEIVQLREQKEAQLDNRLAALEARLAKSPKRRRSAPLVRPAG